MDEKIKKIYDKLDLKYQEYFKKYTSFENGHPDFSLFVGACNAIGEAMTIIEKEMDW